MAIPPVQVKRDPWVIVPYSLFTGGTLIALVLGKITVPVFLAILGALNVASAFGLKKGRDDDDTPTKTNGDPYRTFTTIPPASPPPDVRERVVAEGRALARALARAFAAIRALHLPRLTYRTGVFSLVLVLQVGSALACGAATPAQKAKAADATFTADMLACVDNASTHEQAERCRADVRATWHVDGGVR